MLVVDFSHELWAKRAFLIYALRLFAVFPTRGEQRVYRLIGRNDQRKGVLHAKGRFGDGKKGRRREYRERGLQSFALGRAWSRKDCYMRARNDTRRRSRERVDRVGAVFVCF